MVLDDFFANPDEVTELASELDFANAKANGQFKRYIGERARMSVFQDDIMAFLYPKLPVLTLELDQYYRFETVFTKFDLSHLSEMDVRQFVPHVDTESSVSVVIYLSELGNASHGGTAFYRHLPTGLAEMPFHPTQQISLLMREQRLDPLDTRQYTAFIKSLMYSDLSIRDRFPTFTGLPESFGHWEMLARVKPQRNRLVAFPGRLFHSPVIDAREQTAERLTQNLFFMPQ